MFVGLVIGKDKSTGVPGKNVRTMLGRPMAEYAFIAGRAAGLERMFVSTDSATIAAIGKDYGAVHVVRPPELATPESLTEDVLTHAAQAIEASLGAPPEGVVLLFANNPAVPVELLREGMEALRQDPSLDSAFSVCRYDMFSPTRARQVSSEGTIEPFVDLSVFGDAVSSIRSSQGHVYFCDLAVQVMRWRCFTHMHEGRQPFLWMGRKSKALINDYGFDVDSEWQFVVIEHWLRKRGFTEDSIPYALNRSAWA